MNLYFLRHGKTVYNKKDILHGLSDSPLLEEALETSERTGKFFEKKNIATIYSSPLERARRTAEIISKYLGRPVVYDERLVEICYGDFEERKKSELRKLAIWKKREEDKFNFKHPGEYKGVRGQSYREKCKDLEGFFKELIALRENAIVVAHSGICMAARNFFNKDSKGELGYVRQKNNEIYHVHFIDNGDYKERIFAI